MLRTLLEHRELLANLVTRELKARYRGSVLGFLWSILIPLFMSLIYVVFLRLLGGKGVPTVQIIIGVFAWQFTVQCVNSGMSSITGSVNLVKKVMFPRVVLPAAATLANLVNYLLSLLVQFPVVMVLLHANGQSMSPLVLALPLVIALQLAFNLALALLLAASNVYFRDTQHLVGVVLTAWFFVSPVMYDVSFVARAAERWPWALDAFMLNPIAVIVTAYRALSLPDTVFPWSLSAALSVAAVPALLALAYAVFQRAQRNFADML
jgi:ABC-type polysaccharide/polyol phosphate export permease